VCPSAIGTLRFWLKSDTLLHFTLGPTGVYVTFFTDREGTNSLWLGVMRPGPEVDHQVPSYPEAKYTWSYTSTWPGS